MTQRGSPFDNLIVCMQAAPKSGEAQSSYLYTLNLTHKSDAISFSSERGMIGIFDMIKKILYEFNNLQYEPDLQISSMCPTLERLGSI